MASLELLPSYKDKLGDDATNMLHNIKLGLSWSIAVRDLQRGVGFYVRMLNRYLQFKYKLPEGDRVLLINLLVECISLPGHPDMALLAKWVSALARLIKKQKTPLNISWKFVYDLLLKVVPFPTAPTESSFNGRVVEKQYLDAVARLAKVARKHYDPTSSIDSIFAYFRPYFCPHDNITFTAQSLLVLLLPTHAPATTSYPYLLEEVLTMWGWVSGVDEWDFQWIGLLARWAKDQPELDWSPYLGLIFQNLLRVFDLSLAGGSTILKPTKHLFPAEASITHHWHHNQMRYASMAKLVAYMERPDGRVQVYLDQLFSSIGSYFHPSNNGEWSEGLGTFLEYLCKYYAKRATTGLPEKFLACIDKPLQYALYGKRDSMRAAAVSGFMHLAYVAPEILDSVLPRVYEALETVTAAHQTRAVLELLATIAHPLFSRTIYPKGGSNIALLGLTLPGIDANDVGKTTAAYKFYYRFLTTVPLFEGGESSASQTEHDNEALSSTYSFSEWACAFVERSLSFLSNKEDETSKPLKILFEGAMELFFTQLSEPLYLQAVKKLFSTVTTYVYEKSIKEVGFMCGAASHAQPAHALKLFVPFYLKALVTVDKSGQEGLQSHSEYQLSWHLTMLAHIVLKSGSALVQYEKQLSSILKVSLASEDVKVYKAAHKLLRSILSALVQYYPLDLRSQSPAVWNSKEFQGSHWMRWGNTERSVAWHEPSAAEYELARRIIETTLHSTLASLTAMAQGAGTPPSPYSRAAALQLLERIRAVVRGATPLLRPAALPHTPPVVPELRDHRGWCATTSPPIVVGDFPAQLLMSDVREKVANTLHLWCEFLAKNKPDEIGPYKVICKISHTLFTNYGVSISTHQRIHQEYNILKNKWKNSKKLKTRNFIVAKAHMLHISRQHEDSFHTSSTEPHWTKQLLRDLHSLSLNGYTEVRVRAQNTLLASIRRHPIEIKPFAHVLLQTLATTALSNKDELTGVLHLLVAPTLTRKIVAEWTLRSELAVAFVACLAHQLQQQQRTDVWNHHTLAYFTRFAAFSCVQFRAIPILSPVIGPSKSAEYLLEETLHLAQKTLLEHNQANKQAFQAIIASLASVLDDKTNFNWKFKVMAVAQILWQVRPGLEALAGGDDANSTQAHVAKTLRWLVHSMSGDSPPLRSISTRFISSLLRTIKSPCAYDSKTKNYQWWNQSVPTPPANPNPNPTAPHLAGILAIAGSELNQAEFVGRLVANLQEDHVFKSADEERGGGLDPLLAAAQRKFHFLGRFTDIASVLGQFTGALSTHNQQDATSNLLGELLRVGRQWPYTRTPLQAEGFNTVNARLFKGLFKLFGASFVDHVKPIVDRLLTQSDRACQSTAAEILAGGLRVVHKRGALSAQDHPWADSLGWITSSLLTGVLGAPPECIVDWMACVRFGTYNQDPSRVSWLVERLFRSYETSSTASSQAKPLYYIKAILSELTWRAPALQEKLVADLSRSLAHPYKQLRQEIGEIVSLVVGFSWQPIREAASNRAILAPPTLPEYLKEFLRGAFAEANQVPPTDQAPTMTDEVTTRTSHLRATLLHSIIHAFTQAHAQGLLPNLGPLVGPLFAAQTDHDHDVTREARQACGLVAQAYHWPSSLASLFPYLFPIGSSSSWRVRSALLPFLQILAYNNIFNIATEDTTRLYEFVLAMLSDPQIEVRELARGTLSSLLKGIAGPRAPKKFTETELAAHFLNLTKGGDRHAGVLGLVAIVGAHPYDLPQWLPGILVALAHQVGGKTSSSISDTAKKGLMEFWRTHQDTWAEDQQLLTPDQRDALKERLASPSYYA